VWYRTKCGTVLTSDELERRRVGKRARRGAGELRSKAFRHTDCAARLQTLERAPVSIYPVARARPRVHPRKDRILIPCPRYPAPASANWFVTGNVTAVPLQLRFCW
jgi:hypothetical protein